MPRARKAWGLLLLLLLGATAARAAWSLESAADLILTDGRVYTPSGWAQALAVQRGVIVAVGSVADVDALRGERTRIVDLQGATVIPGMHDLHAHPLLSGRGAAQCRIAQGSSAAQLAAAVKACAAERAPDAWIVGGQWDAASLGDANLGRFLLDRAAPGRAVLVHDISGHALLASSRALQLAGITRDTRDPDGGRFERGTHAANPRA